jgi:hypothetical protein
MPVKFKGTIKKDRREYNGLDDGGHVYKGLVDSPLDRVYVVALLEVAKIDIDVEGGGTKTPVMKFVAIEAATGDNAITVKNMLDASFASRTGHKIEPTLFDHDPEAGEPEHVGDILQGKLAAVPDPDSGDKTPKRPRGSNIK